MLDPLAFWNVKVEPEADVKLRFDVVALVKEAFVKLRAVPVAEPMLAFDTDRDVPVAAPKDRFEVVAKANNAFTLEAVVTTNVVPVAEIKPNAPSEDNPETVSTEAVVVARFDTPVAVRLVPVAAPKLKFEVVELPYCC
jgi:hypothetical protein